MVDSSVAHTAVLGQDAKLAAQALPAAAPSVPALDVPVPHLVAPVILVEQRLGEIVPARPDGHGRQHARDQGLFSGCHAVGRECGRIGPGCESRRAPGRAGRGATPEAGMSAPASPLPKDGSPRSEAMPFGALPGNACGHDGPSGSGGMCLGDGVAVVPAAAAVLPTSAFRAACR